MICRSKPLSAFLAILFIAFSCKEKKADPAGNPAGRDSGPLLVDGFVAVPRNLATAIQVPGSVMPFEETEIRSEISGRVVQLNIREGSFVSRGTLLVKLFDEDLQAQFKKLQVQLEIAEKTVERQQELLKIGGISQQEVDLSELEVNNLKADIEIVKVNIAKTEIRAPFSGTLGLKNISTGAYISPATIIANIRQINELKLQFSVPEIYSSQVEKGQGITFTIGGSLKTFRASVLATEANVEETSRTLIVRAIISSKDKEIIPGIFAEVSLVLGKNNAALMIPTLAVVPQGRDKQVFIYKSGKAQLTNITTGVRDSTLIQVVSGIHPGDTVITTGLLFLRPGSEVQLTSAD